VTRHLPLLFLCLVVVLVGAIPPARHALLTGASLLATGQLGKFQDYLQSLGAWAPSLSIGLMIAESVFIPVPIAIIMVANGLVFGLWGGVLVSLTGGLLGALAAYAIGRHFGRALVARILPAASLHAADRLMAKHGAWAIVLERWIPGIPGDPMSYAAGLTHVPPGTFLLLTAAGLLPANLVTAYVGVEVAGDVPLAYWLGGLAVVAAVWIGWRLVRRRRSTDVRS
jgi:uncharacterized membrane protein YdjX (TVP38/TMEM64 family)